MILQTQPRVRLILPPYDLMPPKAPVLFLAGPITHARDWQADAVKLVVKYATNQDIDIANPRRSGWTKLTPHEYLEQVDWEHMFLERAVEARNGVILFWLAKPEVKSAERAFGQTTRFEIAEAMMNHIYRRARVVVGIEEGFGNERYIRHTFSKKARDIPLLDTLEETVQVATEMIAGRY